MGLTVSVDDNQEAVMAEQVIEIDAEVGQIAEMAAVERLDSYIPGLSERGRVIAAANSDEHPEFPVVRVEEGWSVNGRLWDGAELVSIAEQINSLEPVGHWGHINPQNVAWEAPEPQTTWLGAVTRDEPSKKKDRKGQVVKTLYAAGYNLPDAPIRTYIKSRAVRGISWLGKGKEIAVPGRGVQVRDFKLWALDWARKLSEGMPTSSIVGVTSEMEGVMTVGDKALAQVTPEEFKKENPNGYALLVSEAVAEKETTISEMEEKVEEAKGSVDLLASLRELLQVDEKADILDVVSKMIAKAGEFSREAYEGLLDTVLKTKVTDEKTRPLVKRLILADTPVSEMREKNTEELVAEQVDEKIDKDEEIRAVISEMAPAGRAVARRTELRGGEEGEKKEHKKGTSTGHVKVGSAKL